MAVSVASDVTPFAMPIYAYKCSACGHAEDVMQKMSDAALTVCPKCGAASFSKQVTAPNFALKGSGWYVTDFRSNGSAPAAKEGAKAADKEASAQDSAAAKAEKPATGEGSAPATPAATESTKSSSSAVPAASTPAAT